MSASESLASSIIIVFVRGLPNFPKLMQNWHVVHVVHLVGSTPWIGDIWLIEGI
jgi:hypothetical protein